MSRHFYISTGEVSGELHAARLVEALRRRAAQAGERDIRFTGMGGSILRDAGVETVVDMDGRRAMGFVEVVRHVPFLRNAARRVVEHVRREKTAAVILTDYPGFHLRLASRIRRAAPGVPILYYIAPKAWAWNERRARVLAGCADKVLCILPFEPDWFQARGVNAEYVGNPTLDAVREAPDGSELRAQLAPEPGRKLVALFPGSRPAEIRRLLPLFLETARLLDDGETRFAVAAAPGMDEALLRAAARIPESVPVIRGRNLELLAASDAVLAKSGTTTLEAAFLQTPMAVAYRAHPLSAFLARRLVRTEHFSLPNLAAGRPIVSEFFQEEATPSTLAAALTPLLRDEQVAENARRELGALRDIFGEGSAADRAAAAIDAYEKS